MTLTWLTVADGISDNKVAFRKNDLAHYHEVCCQIRVSGCQISGTSPLTKRAEEIIDITNYSGGSKNIVHFMDDSRCCIHSSGISTEFPVAGRITDINLIPSAT